MSSTNRSNARDSHASAKFSGVGYLGILRKMDHPRLYSIRREMIRRCYNTTSIQYRLYGQKGVSVSPDWWCFDNFVRDSIKLDGWDEVLFQNRRVTLDKDKKQLGVANKVYSKDTCWLSKEDQFKYADHRYRHKYFVGTFEGNYYVSKYQKVFAAVYSIQKTLLSHCLRGVREQHKGWTFQYLTEIPNRFTYVNKNGATRYVVYKK